ncbi:Mitochondrial matrix Mmp37 domain-containing protein, partial [Rozella allomycis CSF55]
MSFNKIKYRKLVDIVSFFKAPIDFAVAYGSAVFPQSQRQKKNTVAKFIVMYKMYDFIFGVKSPLEFHSENMKQNPDHYSSLKLFGPKIVSCIQEKIPAHIYYNTLIHINGNLIKYGVVSLNDLSNDLKNWNTMFLAGRMHKPISIIKSNSDL